MNKSGYRKPWLVLAAALITGCASMGSYDTTTSVTTPRVGTMIKLKQELTAPAGVRVYLQDGRQKRFSDVAKLEPYCQFYVDRSSDELREPFTIAPDTFVVRRVFRQKESVSLEPVQVAFDGDADFNPGASQRTMSTFMEIVSESQPAVRRLICSRWADPSSIYHVSIDEIVQSLGDLADFIPPAGVS